MNKTKKTALITSIITILLLSAISVSAISVDLNQPMVIYKGEYVKPTKNFTSAEINHALFTKKYVTLHTAIRIRSLVGNDAWQKNIDAYEPVMNSNQKTHFLVWK